MCFSPRPSIVVDYARGIAANSQSYHYPLDVQPPAAIVAYASRTAQSCVFVAMLVFISTVAANFDTAL